MSLISTADPELRESLLSERSADLIFSATRSDGIHCNTDTVKGFQDFLVYCTFNRTVCQDLSVLERKHPVCPAQGLVRIVS